eukprot:Selendium_serpulae@DN160_c0_g1_i1.p1
MIEQMFLCSKFRSETIIVPDNGAVHSGGVMACVVKNGDSVEFRQLNAAVDDVLIPRTEAVYVAFDCEGVNLSRIGSISIGFSNKVFLFDVGDNPDPEVVKEVKRLFEAPTVRKIVHDCRMDSDAMSHILGNPDHHCSPKQLIHQWA